ncbi:hypothetical protein JEP1_004 [Escherichia phage JEP1]|uniref:Head stabilization/decoration protein n=1 Tax=Escherichia phage JEP1 TaxID=2759218 RepID=A0A7S6HUU7_9CAUD|nr:hypothetical protein JEP1_004 [Escherichia phage JEP1]
MSEKTITIKEKGIALCHKAQGYSANNRPVSLLMKSDLKPEQLTDDIVKALRQVTVELSFEEYLRRFFDMWYDDAKALAHLLGFEIEEEAWAKEHPDWEWAQADAEACVQWLEERCDNVTIHKAAKEGKDLSIVDQYTLLKTQQVFEQMTADLFDEEGKLIKAAQETTEEVVTDAVDNVDKSANTEENPVEDVTKSQEYLDLLKQFEELKATNEKAEEIIKAQVEVEKAKMLEKAQALSFATEEDHTTLVEFMLDKANASVVALLEKAQARIAELEAEVEKAKDEFATTEQGKDGDVVVDDIAKSAEDIIAENVAKALARARKESNK